MVSFRITKNGFIGNGSGSLTGSLLGTASHATTASSVAWNDVTGKPSAYPAAAHDHTGDHLKPVSVTTTGDITVGGNLIVNGSQTIIKTKNLTVKDKLIEIASGSTSRAAADGAGIAIQTASAATQEDGEAASARIQYRSSDNHFTASIGFVAPSFTGSLQGTATSASFALDHYVPTQSVGKTVNAGQVISGLGLDAKGHVVTVTGSNTIASASRAVSAESAEKLSTSNVGGTGEPVYFKNGIPVADTKTKGAVDWVTINSESLLTPDEVIWKKDTGTDSAVRVLTGDYEVNTPSATGAGAIAIGTATTASGYYSHAEGYSTKASGWVSHAEGQETVASNDASHAEGYNTKASGYYSHAEGENTEASGWSSHAEGQLTTASGPNSHVEGNQTTALGGCSHAEGQLTTASSYFSHTEGFYTVTSNDYEHAQGIANHNSTNQIFSVGAGEVKDYTVVTRRNAVSVLVVPNSETQINTASFFIQNVGGYDGTNPTPGTNDLATVINGITANAGTVTSVGVSAGTGITASVTNATTTPTISISSAQAHTHTNKAELDQIASGDVAKWNAKQNAIKDLATIKSNAANGKTAYDWGNHASAGYAKSEDITTAINDLVTVSESKWSTDTKVTSVDNHYTPKQSTAKTVSAGFVISGIYLDAAGHVTGVSGSKQINNATIAEKLKGTSGSADVPVYIDAGVPKECKANLVSLPIFSGRPSEGQAQSGTITLSPGTVHKCGTLSKDLTINLDTSSIGSHEAIYCCVFNMGSTLKTITLPKDVKVVENSADLDTTGVYYEINIMNNVAIIARTSAS